MTTTYDHLLYLSRAGANILHVASYEWERVRGHVIGIAKAVDLPLRIWSQSAGLLRCSGVVMRDATHGVVAGSMESGGSGVFTSLLVDALNGAAANLVGDVTPGSVYAHIDPGNTASLRVAANIGMRYEGDADFYGAPTGRYVLEPANLTLPTRHFDLA